MVSAGRLHKAIEQTMHYIDIDWYPSAIAIALAATVVVSLRVFAWVGQRRARVRTQLNIERVLSEHDRDDSASKTA